VLERAFEIFSQQLKVRGIDVKWQTAPDLPRIMGNPSRLGAGDHQSAHQCPGCHRRTIGPDAGQAIFPDRIHLVTTSNHKTVTLSVGDTGAGVPEPIRGKIFEPFFTTKKVGKGTGLGLSISYSIVKECNGTIDVTESPGGGACFNLHFPIMKEPS
jgi:histidine kinase